MPSQSYRDKKKIEKLNKALKSNIDDLIQLKQKTVAFYYDEDGEMISYGHPAMVMTGIDGDAIEAHPRFHDDPESMILISLPTAINLLVMTFVQAKEFLKIWLPKFLGYFPGYGKLEKRPTWWVGQWEKSPQSSGWEKIELLKIIAALYHHYENTVLVLPPEAIVTAATQTEVQAPDDDISLDDDIDIETIDAQVEATPETYVAPWLNNMEVQTEDNIHDIEMPSEEQLPQYGVPVGYPILNPQHDIPSEHSSGIWNSPTPIAPTAAIVHQHDLPCTSEATSISDLQPPEEVLTKQQKLRMAQMELRSRKGNAL